ncbi:Uma2 family endonuclease [Streptomyces sp. NBC_01750]|uniref:Uma2 family endonuclease n=1 Tax=Streptomyces sp. NBC_01750 TaxID=2975928 RepID=UPI003FA3CCBD
MGTPICGSPGAPEPSWPTPPLNGWTADDLDRLPNLPPHTELIDTSLVFPTPQTLFHERAIGFFSRQLESVSPQDLEVFARFTIDIDRWNRPEPDVIVVRGDVVQDPEQTRLPADSVVLAIEVVSTDSVTRDRETKPVKYARAEIPHYWRVEDVDGRAVVHVFELEPATGAYTSTGIFHDRMKVSVPFPVDLDLAQIKPRRSRAAEE